MIRQVDRDGDGEIDFSEFIEVIAQETKEKHSKDEILSVFRAIDEQGHGYITSDELRQIMNHLGEYLPEEEIEDIISELDTNKDGKIDFDEFCKVMMPGEE
jgi:Ca2+-binding EF-hand superfamily protein